jgi:hypothetical protein
MAPDKERRPAHGRPPTQDPSPNPKSDRDGSDPVSATGDPRSPRPEGPPAVGASDEVLRHHGQRHIRECQARGTSQRVCPCGRAVALLHGCGDVLFLAMAPGPPCVHAREVWAA